MNSMIVKNYQANFTEYEESTFILYLDNNKIMEVPMWSFFLYMSDLDDNLFVYGGKFPEWEQLTSDLLSLGYDFLNALNVYIQQFDDEQIMEFSTIQDGYDYEDLDDDDDDF